MDRFTEEGLDALHKEVDKLTPLLTQKVLEEVDGLVESKLIMARNELSQTVDQKVQTALSGNNKEMEKKFSVLRRIGFAALGISLVALGTALSAIL
jgi:hypothetical protein